MQFFFFLVLFDCMDKCHLDLYYSALTSQPILWL